MMQVLNVDVYCEFIRLPLIGLIVSMQRGIYTFTEHNLQNIENKIHDGSFVKEVQKPSKSNGDAADVD